MCLCLPDSEVIVDAGDGSSVEMVDEYCYLGKICCQWMEMQLLL